MAFDLLRFSSWIEAIVRPNTVLGIPVASVREFQILALVFMDNIWLVYNKLLFEAVQPIPNIFFRRIKSSTTHYLKA